MPRSGASSSFITRLLVVLASSTAVIPRTASAGDDPYCARVSARAASDAALLFGPTVQAQGIKFPRNGTIDASITTGDGYQFRAGVSWSALDLYKGFQVMDVANADCAQHNAVADAQDAFDEGLDVARGPALKAQVAAMEGHRKTWEQVLDDSEHRLEAHLTSLLDANEVRARVSELERKLAATRGELERLEARGIKAAPRSLTATASAVESATIAYERQVSHLRSLDAWDVRLTGGVVPHGFVSSSQPIDWYGIVVVGYNFGGPFRTARESRYLEARVDELRRSRHQLGDQVRMTRARIASAKRQGEGELAIIERRTRVLDAARTALRDSDAPNAPHVLAVLDLDAIFVDADRTYLTSLIAALSQLSQQEEK